MCLKTLLNVTEMKPKYTIQLLNQPDFHHNLSNAIGLCEKEDYSDLCLLCFNLIATDNKITQKLVEANAIQRMLEKLRLFEFSQNPNDDYLYDVKIEFINFFLQVIATVQSSQVGLIIFSPYAFKAFTLVSELLHCQCEDYIFLFLNTIIRALQHFQQMGNEYFAQLVDLLEESKVNSIIRCIDYADERFSKEIRLLFELEDSINYIEENDDDVIDFY